MRNLRNKTAVVLLRLAKYVTMTALTVRYTPPQKPLTDAEIMDRANEIDKRAALHELDAMSQMLSILTALCSVTNDDLDDEARDALHREAHTMIHEINDPASAHLIIDQMAHRLAITLDPADLIEMGHALAMAREASA